MKKIIIIISLLVMAIVTMAYLYFSKLNADHNTTDVGLHAATSTSGLIFSFENQKEITDILKEQPLFSEILGAKKYKQLSAIKKYLLMLPSVNQETENQQAYITFVPGTAQEIDFICFTQLQTPVQKTQMLQSIKQSGTQVQTLKNLSKLSLADSTICYLAVKENLIVLSNSQEQVTAFLSKKIQDKEDKFANYIQTGNKFNKNSLAQLYINFNTIPLLLKNIVAGKLNGELSVLDNLDAFASLTYNYSKEKVLLTGTTIDNNPNSYYNLFSELQAKKMSIQNMLPANTSSYTIFAIDNYLPWRKKLLNWQANNKENKKANQIIEEINAKYHLNLDDILPKYFKDQLITFQLSSTEKIGAINLSNGDKLTQLLIDLSSDYNGEIKVLKEAGILNAYFGLPFEGFKKPFYVIFDNYMVFANNAATLQDFLNNYDNNLLLINTPNYINASNQLPVNASISIYIDHSNSNELFRKNIYLPYYKHLQSDEGLKKYDSFTYQLSGDNGKFQTNILINKQPEVLQKDSLAL
ncbi:hypothetical protein [Pedobacter nyackensis]|uniref:hypothetical protein n=1 Tax=Pedobacter nyackensis TaxID=475255 RepID=UPI00292EA35E|nr:hypothetical protein [Pedobacter nyackensis]